MPFVELREVPVGGGTCSLRLNRSADGEIEFQVLDNPAGASIGLG